MRNIDAPKLLPALSLGALLVGLTGCPAQSACPPCYVGDVMADASSPTRDPSSTLNLQLGDVDSKEITEIHVVLSSKDGSKTLTYPVPPGLNNTSLTTIEDDDLYDVDGKPPTGATVEFVLNSGKTLSETIKVEPEDKKPSTSTPAAGEK